MSSATLAASASPHSSAIRCSARSMPAVIPALDATGPSMTNTRLSITCAPGARARSCRQQLVVRGAAAGVEQAGPRREQRARADRRPRGAADPRRAVSSPNMRLSHRAVAAIAGVTRPSWALGWPTSTTQVGVLSCSGNGSRSTSPSPTEVDSVATGPAKRSRKRGGSPRAWRCRLARRNASAGPAMSSSSECGAMTNRRSIR